jgi:opacity protein-like surface antigen
MRKLAYGVALLAVASLSPAEAADIAAAIVEEAESNWYVSLHGGMKWGEDWPDVATLNDAQIYEATFNDPDLCENSAVDNEVCFHDLSEDNTLQTDKGFRVGGALGFLISDNFAVEAEIGYMKQNIEGYRFNDFTVSNAVSQTVECAATGFLCKSDADGDVRILTGMINAFFAMPLGGVFRPYVGVGGGLAHVSFKDFNLVLPGGATERICCSIDDSDVVFAAQGFVGLDIGITEDVAIGGRFRYLRLSNIVLDDSDSLNSGFLYSHEFDSGDIKSAEVVLMFGL